MWQFCRNMLLLYSQIIHNISLQSILTTAFSAAWPAADFSFDAEFSDGRVSVMVENYKQCFLNKMIKEKQNNAFVYCSILTISCLTFPGFSDQKCTPTKRRDTWKRQHITILKYFQGVSSLVEAIQFVGSVSGNQGSVSPSWRADERRDVRILQILLSPLAALWILNWSASR